MAKKEESNNQILSYHILEDEKNIFDSDKKFKIPLYQREFAWEFTEITALIDDIYDFEGDIYYMGSMIVAEHETYFEIIDGQQRLTAFYLLLNYLSLQDNVNISKIKTNLVYECRDKSKYTLDNIDKIIKNDSKDIDEEMLEENILNGLDIIKQYFKSNNIDIHRFISNLKKVVIFKIHVPEDTDLNRYFEIMNTRGEQLEQQDILKANLMSYLNHNDGEIFAIIWNACKDMSGYVQMHFKYKRVAPRNAIFSRTWNKIPSDDWKKYNVLIDCEQKKENDEDDEIYDKYQSIIDFPYFLLHCLKTYAMKNNITDIQIYLDDKKLLKSFNNVIDSFTDNQKKIFPKNFILHLLKSRFLFDKYFIKRRHENPDDDGVWSLQEIKENNGKKQPINTFEDRNVLMLQAALRVSYTSPKNMNWITECLSCLLNDNEDYIQFIENILKESVIKNFLTVSNFRYLGVSTPHVVFNYLDYLLWKEDRRVSFDFEFRNSVEHWYPQNPSENTFPRWSNKYGPIDRFGNLCIIQRNINARFSNKTPESKIQDHEKVINKGSLKLRNMRDSTVETENLRAHKNWMINKCKSHENEMLGKLFEACKNYKIFSKIVCDILTASKEHNFQKYIHKDFSDYTITKLDYRDGVFIYFSTNYDHSAFQIGFWNDKKNNHKELPDILQKLDFPDYFEKGYIENNDKWIYIDFTFKDIISENIIEDIKKLLLSLKISKGKN